VAAQAFPDRHIVPQQQALLGLVDGGNAQARKQKRGPLLGDFLTFAREVLGWEDDFVMGSPARRGPPTSASHERIFTHSAFLPTMENSRREGSGLPAAAPRAPLGAEGVACPPGAALHTP
jgi:hypothetical protein